MNEVTFVIIKPDAFARSLVGKIISRFEGMGLYFERIEKRRKNIQWCRQHYSHVYIAQKAGKYEEKDVCGPQEHFMVSDTIGIILVGENVVKRVKRMVGVTNVTEAEPGTIRGDFGQYSGCYNLVHASDSVEAAKKEIELYFNKETDQ